MDVIPWSRMLGVLGVLVSVMVAVWWGIDKSDLEVDSQQKDPIPVLTRVDPVKVGYIRDIQLVSGQMHKIKTLSMRPALFEIENFLSEEECNDIIFMAETQGLENSRTVLGGVAQPNHTVLEKLISDPAKIFKDLDANKNGVIDVPELAVGISYLANLLLTDDLIKNLMVELDLDADKNGEISQEEYTSMIKKENLQKLFNYTNAMKKKEPNRRARVSNTAFLSSLDHVGNKMLFENLKKRIQLVTGLPKEIIWYSEDLQVLRYDKHGHYHCHLDSLEEEDENLTCCHYSNWESEQCLPCRYLTFFYYLNEPEEGGETAFPIADNDPVAIEQIQGKDHHLCDLSNHCHEAKIAYKPKRGTALFWYNHNINHQTGWLGDVDKMSYHGGCNVQQGTKWAANNWINVGKDRKMDEKAWAIYKEYMEEYENPKEKTNEVQTEENVKTEALINNK